MQSDTFTESESRFVPLVKRMQQEEPAPTPPPLGVLPVLDPAAMPSRIRSHISNELHFAMQARREKGLATYGTELYPCNGRDALTDAEQEIADAAVYLVQASREQDGDPDPLIGDMLWQLSGVMDRLNTLRKRRDAREEQSA